MSVPRSSPIAYLDPATGRFLMVDVVAAGVERTFKATPDRWRYAAMSACEPALAAAG